MSNNREQIQPRGLFIYSYPLWKHSLDSDALALAQEIESYQKARNKVSEQVQAHLAFTKSAPLSAMTYVAACVCALGTIGSTEASIMDR